MRIEADLEMCCAAGMCALTAPEVFDQDEEEGTVVVLVDRPPAEHHAAVRDAVRACPSRALSLREGE
ncbi:ferredoxin [Streptomyces sp. NPDC058794]|uniref:ferredoxin n=1 Tax=unclassified Streptomyces TaxID=2593676 RepID=UPI0036CFCAF9